MLYFRLEVTAVWILIVWVWIEECRCKHGPCIS